MDSHQDTAWGSVSPEDSTELSNSIAYLSQQDLRTDAKNRDAWSALIERLSVNEGVRFGSLDYVHADSISREEFDTQYVAAAQPCMVRGCTSQWRAASRWKSAEDLSTWYGDVGIRITEVRDPRAGQRALRVPLSKYLCYAKNDGGGADFPWYGFEDDLTGERSVLARGKDWDVPFFCSQDCYDASAEARHVFPRNTFFIVGGARTGTNLHVDPNCTSAWNSLLCGRKRWALFPPVDSQGIIDMGIEQDGAKVKRTPPCWWWQEVYPSIVANGSAERYGMIECIQEPGDTIFVPEGWWHTVLNLNLTIAITANPLPPSTLHRVWPRLDWPPLFLKRLACQCVREWPHLRLRANTQAQPLSAAKDDKKDDAGGEAFLKSLREGEDEGFGGGEDGGAFGEAALQRWLRGMSLGPRPHRCVLIVNMDEVLYDRIDMSGAGRRERSVQTYGEDASGIRGGLCTSSMLNLQRVLALSGAELVLSGRSRVSKAAREALSDELGRWGLHFSRWTTTAELPGGEGAQVLDFVTRQLNTQGAGVSEAPWAVLDAQNLGKELGEEGALMMEVLLRQNLIVVGAEGYTDCLARSTLEILMGEDD